MKFIHTADIHWGMIPDSDKPWGKKREQAIRLTFQGIIEDARDSRADLLLISGDLFHRQPLARDLKEVNYLFSTIPGTRVVIIAGNHDRIRKSSALLSFTWAPNVTFLMGEELSSVYFEELNTEVYGFSSTQPRSSRRKPTIFPCRPRDAPEFSCSTAVTRNMSHLIGMRWQHPRSPTSPWDISTNRRFFWKTAWPTPVPRNRLT